MSVLMRPLPEPEQVPDARKLRRLVAFAPGQGPQLVSISQRAVAVLGRCYEPLPRHAPHGFRDPHGFVAACRMADAHERLYRSLFWQIASKEVERGRLRVELAR